MDSLTIVRVLAGPRRGSSRPVLVETTAGQWLVKLRGAAQGIGVLVAEIIVAGLAEVLGLRVPSRALVALEPDTPTDDRDAELRDLLAASLGLNLGFAPLPGARDAMEADLTRLPPAEMAAILWLDRLVLNPDRTSRNPNLLWCDGQVHLIDHGAALRFQYDWPAVTEATPRAAGVTAEPHVFDAITTSKEWAAWDAALANRLTRVVLEDVVAQVPADFLLPLLPGGALPAPSTESLRRRRAAYVAFLWKRLKAPRPFV